MIRGRTWRPVAEGAQPGARRLRPLRQLRTGAITTSDIGGASHVLQRQLPAAGCPAGVCFLLIRSPTPVPQVHQDRKSFADFEFVGCFLER